MLLLEALGSKQKGPQSTFMANTRHYKTEVCLLLCRSIFPRKCVREIPEKRLLKHFCIINILVKSNESIQPSCSKHTRPAGKHYCPVRQTDTVQIRTSEKCCLQMQHLFSCIKGIRRRG